MQQKINIQQLSGEISLRNGCSQSISDQFLKELFAIVTEELKNSKSITIAGLGEFKRDKDDPNADKSLCEQLNQPFSCFEPIELADDISEEDLFIKTDEHSKYIQNSIVNLNEVLKSYWTEQAVRCHDRTIRAFRLPGSQSPA